MDKPELSRDSPEFKNYLRGLFGFACGFGLCGTGGDVSIRRNTPSSVGGDGSLLLFMDGGSYE